MEAVAGRIYAQIVNGKFQWQFTQAELPEWADDAFEVVDITDKNPMPTVGIEYSNGAFIFPAEAVKTPAEIFSETQAVYNKAVQAYIVSIAQKKGYRDDVSCASYFNDPHQPFASDAQAFVPWRSSVWLQCYTDLASIQAGTMPMPASPAAYILTLPAVPAGF
jgi:hypothetical protein